MRINISLLKTCLFLVLAVFFLTTITSAQNNGKKETVKIGLLIPDSKSLAAKNGAELAIRSANEKGDPDGLTFRMIVSSMEGPWGTGSREAVTMIFDENVAAILGSNDGRNAHLVEQVAAKSRVVFLSAWTSDPSLAQAFVPWFFNCVPNDILQASALDEEIYVKRKLVRIAVISDNSYDSKSILNNFMKVIVKKNRPEPMQLSADDTATVSLLADKVKGSEIQGIVLLVQPPNSGKIAREVNIRNIDCRVFGSLALLDENKISGKALENYENIIIVSPGDISGIKALSFREEYKKSYGTLPGAVASYAFDGMNMLIDAIRKSGSGYEKIQKSLAGTRYEGVTGTIQFDDKGNRKGTPGFVEIKKGIPVNVK